MESLLEEKRNQLVAKSKKSSKGLQRYRRRFKSKIAKSNREYNNIDMDKLFKSNILNIAIKIKGETDEYIVKLSFGGVLDSLKDELKRNNDKFDLRAIAKAIIIAFNKSDAYIKCSCPDFLYRFGYYATVNKFNEGEPQLIPSNETNPDDSLGSACKHTLLVLSNTSWIIKVASVIKNYVNYMELHRQSLYAKFIYPAIYGKKYEEPVQQSILNDEEDKEIIDTANEYAKTKTQFKPGNEYRITNKEIPNDQTSIEEIEEGEE